MDRKLNYKHIYETLVNGLAKYVTNNKMETMIIGVSGGLDSSVVSAIAREVSIKTGVKLIGVSLMCNTNQNDEVTNADLVGKEFCDEYHKENIQGIYEAVSAFCKESCKETTPVAEGNIKARLRMLYLWHLGGLRKGLVLDTDNITENALGFFTVNGDVNYLSPIGALWKTEVYALAKYMLENVYVGSEALKGAIEITPTDGNGVKAGGDLAQIGGKSFDEVDDILYHWVSLADSVREKFAADKLGDSIKGSIFDVESEESKTRRMEYCKKACMEFVPSLGDKYGVDVVRKVILRSIGSEFKRKKMPLKLSLTNGELMG